MRDIAEVLKQKEAEIQRLETEVEALRLVARLLSEEPAVQPPNGQAYPATKGAPVAATGTTNVRSFP